MKLAIRLVSRPEPAAISAATIRNQIESDVTRFVEDRIKTAHEANVSTWEGGGIEPNFGGSDIPTFKTSSSSGNEGVLVSLEMEAAAAEDADLSVWQLLDRGTRVRYMIVSEDWSSKTEPRVIGASGGAGEKLGLDFEDPDPGIEEREFSETIGELHEPELDGLVRRAIDVGISKAFR